MDLVLEAYPGYGSEDDKSILHLMALVRKGIKYSGFTELVKSSPFNLSEWSAYLNLSERTMQRYQKEKTTFGVNHSEKILQLAMLLRYGNQVFGSKSKFSQWLETTNLALANQKPKNLLDTSFGITLVKDELTRIEHGVLA